jgi:cell division septal protein FtsQ
MGEERNMKEQIASHTYKQQAPSGVFPVNAPEVPLAEKPKGGQDPKFALEKDFLAERLSEAHSLGGAGGLHTEASQLRRRVVTIPKADPSAAWNTFSERREQLQREREKPRQYTAVVQRAHAQMALHATDGHISILQRLPAVPDRSGRKAARRRLLWRLLSFFCIAAALLIAIGFALSSNALRIEQVNVVGTHNVALTAAIQRMGMQGQNIFLLDVEALTERIAASPLVASASLDKQWPNQLTVTVVERKPVLLWQTAKGTYGVDGQGMVIAAASELTGTDHLNTVIDTSNRLLGQQGKVGSLMHAGSHVRQADISFAMKVFTNLPQVIGSPAFQLHYDDTIYTGNATNFASYGGGSYVVESSAGWIAYLGGASDTNPLENRLIELQQILAIAQQQHLSLATVDLRYGLYPVYTLK